MEAKILDQKIVLQITLTATEYKLILDGLGSTSINSRMKAGMTEEQSQAVGMLFHTLNEAQGK